LDRIAYSNHIVVKFTLDTSALRPGSLYFGHNARRFPQKI